MKICFQINHDIYLKIMIHFEKLFLMIHFVSFDKTTIHIVMSKEMFCQVNRFIFDKMLIDNLMSHA